MDRTKQLETAIEKAIERLEPVGGLRAAAAYNVLRAALAPAEKVPLTCPRCGKPLVDCTDSIDEFVCVAKDCGYSQKDSAQRPPYPAPREGYHAGECVKPVEEMHEAWFNWSGEFIHTWESSKPAQDKFSGFRWIAVKDAPVSEPVPVCQSCNILGRQCTLPSGHDGAHNVTDENGVLIALWNDPPPSPVKVPVVPGCRLPTKEEIDWCVNNLTNRNPQFDVDLSLGEKALAITTVWIASIGGVYESARKPDKPAIEPLGDTEFGRAEMHDKLNELVARVNALEGGGG